MEEKDYAAEGEDFDFEVGETVWVQGVMCSQIALDQNGKTYFKNWTTPPWEAKIIKRWFDEDCEVHIWYEVEAVEKPPEWRKPPFVVSETEIKRTGDYKVL
jgi:hypothetical protein